MCSPPSRGDEESTPFAVLVDGEVAGLIQYYEEDDPEYRHAGIDVFLGAPFQGHGLGTDAVATLARHLVHDRGHHRLMIDPAAENAAAIRCYERVGFRRVGVMREHWRGPDGAWHDGLLDGPARGRASARRLSRRRPAAGRPAR